jgi:hypothetical protein
MTEPKVGESRVGNRGAGRVKGVPNKNTAALKDAIMNAFETVGGESYLVRVANADMRTFCTLLGRVLPTEIKADVSDSLADRLEGARRRIEGS